MLALIVGLLFVGAAVAAVLPQLPLNWGPQVLDFLKGGAPVLSALIGLLAIFIGIADMKDRIEAKKEEAREASDKDSTKS